MQTGDRYMVMHIKINEHDVIEVGKYPDCLEIGFIDERCNCGDGTCEAKVHGGEYVNIPTKQVPELIKKLIRLYPDWDKE